MFCGEKDFVNITQTLDVIKKMNHQGAVDLQREICLLSREEEVRQFPVGPFLHELLHAAFVLRRCVSKSVISARDRCTPDTE